MNAHQRRLRHRALRRRTQLPDWAIARIGQRTPLEWLVEDFGHRVRVIFRSAPSVVYSYTSPAAHAHKRRMRHAA